MKRRDTDHIVLDYRESTNGGFRCLRCGDVMLPQLPLPWSDWVANGKKFTRQHAACIARAAEGGGAR